MSRALLLAALVALAAAVPAHASELVARGATDARLSVDANGRALVSYRAGGRARAVVAWGAVNAHRPSPSRPQVAFRYSSARAAGFRGRCGRYDGPPLAWFVAACKAPDGTYWALQQWRRLLPGQGRDPAGRRGLPELRLSHWRGELPVLTARLAWIYGRYHHVSGSLTYRGTPVYGFRATHHGAPLDRYGRNVYLDTLDSGYGRGWRREGAFLTHRPTGAFCYGLFRRKGRPSGMGRAYRATAVGPGVTPDVAWQAQADVSERARPCG